MDSNSGLNSNFIEFRTYFCLKMTRLLTGSHRITSLENLYTHTRFRLTLRSVEGTYKSLLLFRLTASQSDPAASDTSQSDNVATQQIYVMEGACPHLGADMSHAEIEDCETGLVAVCPWHR